MAQGRPTGVFRSKGCRAWIFLLVGAAGLEVERVEVERFLASMAEAYRSGDRDGFRQHFAQSGEMSTDDFQELGRLPFWTWGVEEAGTEEGGLWARLVPERGGSVRLTIHLMRSADGRLRMRAPGESRIDAGLPRVASASRSLLGSVGLSVAEGKGLLAIRLEFQPEALRINWSQRFLFLDADGDPETGASFKDTGVRGVEWSFLIYHTAPVGGEKVGFGLKLELLAPGAYERWEDAVASEEGSWHQINNPGVLKHGENWLELEVPSPLLAAPGASRLRWVLLGSAPGEVMEAVRSRP